MFAVVTCPCHLPLLLAVLGGTALGAALSEHMMIAIVAFTILFVLSASAALHLFSRQQPDGRESEPETWQSRGIQRPEDAPVAAIGGGFRPRPSRATLGPLSRMATVRCPDCGQDLTVPQGARSGDLLDCPN